MSEAPLLIAHPDQRRRRDAVLVRLERALRGAGWSPDVVLTGGAGEGTRLARRAVEQSGRRFVVAVGGDDVVHDVVNGLVDARSGEPRGDDVVFGAVAGRDGCDFLRTFGLDLEPERMVRHLTGERRLGVDLGRVRYLDHDGRRQVRLFANVAEAGYGGVVRAVAGRLPRLLGRARYLTAALLAVQRAERVEAAVAVDHHTVREPLSNVVVANGQFFAGGLQVAPRALPDDGSFNVQCWRPEPRDVFAMLPRLRVGDHLGTGEVREYQSTTVRIRTRRPLTLEADGEVLGTTPADFDVLPSVLRMAR